MVYRILTEQGVPVDAMNAEVRGGRDRQRPVLRCDVATMIDSLVLQHA